MKRKILYLQHAEAIGGSAVSLKEILKDSIAHGYECHVICQNKFIADFYSQMDVVVHLSPVVRFNHNTVQFYQASLGGVLRICLILARTALSFIQLSKIAKRIKPDIVHLNSSTLFLYSIFFWVKNVPNIFHVREVVVKGYFGIRRKLIASVVNKTSQAIIYISEFERDVLSTTPDKSYVIYNYVHLNSFFGSIKSNTCKLDFNSIRVITLGGLFKLKGGDIILQAIKNLTNIELLICGSDPNLSDIKIAEGESFSKTIKDLMATPEIEKKVKIIGRVTDPANYINQSDILIFWADEPHFPRPVFEAWLLKKTVVYFNPDFKNEKINRDTVIVVRENSKTALQEAILLARKQVLDESRRNSSYALAIENFTEKNFDKINKIYRLVE